MALIRTPDQSFSFIKDYFKPNYVTIDNARIHYIDEGVGTPILCLHGEPSWGYLYRKMVPIFVQAGYRVICPDLVGFGKSDKFIDTNEYSIQMHYDFIVKFILKLNLWDITLVCHDWGGILGLSVAANYSHLFSKLVIMNTDLPIGDQPPSKGFLAWKAYAEKTKDMIASKVIKGATIKGEELKAYDAPFPSIKYKTGMLVFPFLVTIYPDMAGVELIKQARQKLSKWTKPALVMFSDSDPVTRGRDKFFLNLIPTAKNEPHIIIKEAGHFLQEDKSEEIAENIVKFLQKYNNTPKANL